MMTRALRVLVPGLLLPAFMTHAGGWAVITVDDLPDHAIAGQPLTLSFIVRQHGESPLADLSATVEAVSGRTSTKAKARPGTARGQYVASLDLPKAGNWQITIRSGFGKSDLTLLPLAVLDAGTVANRAVSDIDRGHRLFFAKGCVTCHVQIPLGPNLDGKRFEPTYLAGFLANPKRASRPAGQPEMPNLGLKQREIASLVAYLNSDRQLGAR